MCSVGRVICSSVPHFPIPLISIWYSSSPDLAGRSYGNLCALNPVERTCRDIMWSAPRFLTNSVMCFCFFRFAMVPLSTTFWLVKYHMDIIVLDVRIRTLSWVYMLFSWSLSRHRNNSFRCEVPLGDLGRHLRNRRCFCGSYFLCSCSISREFSERSIS